MKFAIGILIVVLLGVASAATDRKFKAYLTLAKGDHEKIARLHKECLKEMKIDDKLLTTDFEPLSEEHHKKACYHKCMYVKYGVLKDNGELDIEIAKKVVDKKNHPLLEKCYKIKHDDACIRTHQITQCYLAEYEE